MVPLSLPRVYETLVSTGIGTRGDRGDDGGSASPIGLTVGRGRYVGKVARASARGAWHSQRRPFAKRSLFEMWVSALRGVRRFLEGGDDAERERNDGPHRI